MHRTFCLLLVILVCLMSKPTAFAQTPSKETGELPWVAVNADTVCIASFRLSALDVKAMASKLAARLPEEKKRLLDLQVMVASGLLAQLTQAGVDEIYFVGSTRQLLTDNVLIVPCRDEKTVGDTLQMLVNAIPKEFNYKVQREAGLIAICGDHVWKRIVERRSGLQASGESPSREVLNSQDATAVTHWQTIIEPLTSSHWAAASLPKLLRDELSLLWSSDVQIGSTEVSLGALVEDTRSITLSAEANDWLEVSLSVNGEDASAAERIEAQLKQALQAFPQTIDGLKIPKPELSRVDSQVTFKWPNLYAAIELTALHAAESAHASKVKNSLRQIGLAIHEYSEKFGHLPPRATVSPEGKELLSWRVHLLPFLGEQALYSEFKLTEPWDSEHNAKLVAKIPKAYRASQDGIPVGTTCVQVPVTEGALWNGEGQPRKLSDVTDGTSQTIALAIAPPEAAIPWTKPDSWQLKNDSMVQDLFGAGEKTWFLLLDGSVQMRSRSDSAETLKALLTHASGESIP